MFNGKYTHINEIMERVHRDYGFSDIFEDEVKEWVWDCIGYFGRNEVLVPLVDEVIITDNRGILPPDVYHFIGCRDKNTKTPLLPTTDRFFMKNFVNTGAISQAIVQGQSINITTTGLGDNLVEELDASTLMLEFVPTYDATINAEWAYFIQDGYIFTHRDDLTLEVAYIAFPMWEDMTPKIPDDAKVIRMVTIHIAERIAMRLWMQDKLSKQKLDDIRDELSWAVGSAANKMKLVGEDGMESIKKSLFRFVPKPNQWTNGFRELNRGEQLNKM